MGISNGGAQRAIIILSKKIINDMKSMLVDAISNTRLWGQCSLQVDKDSVFYGDTNINALIFFACPTWGFHLLGGKELFGAYAILA